jgi:4-hydroxybenzoate polyprenyltransferase
MKEIVHIIKTSRPIFWLTQGLSLIIGICALENSKMYSIQFFFLAFFLSFPFSLFIYSANDYFDIVSDSNNPRKGNILGLKHTKFEKRKLLWYSLAGFILTFVGMLILSYKTALLFFVIALFLYFYSAKPIRFKGIPIFDAFFGGGVYFSTGGILGFFALGGSIRNLYNFPFGILLLFVLGVVIHLLGAIMDIEYDKKEGTVTSAVFFGYKKTAIFCIVLSLITMYIVRRNFFFIGGSLLTFILSILIMIPAIRKSTHMKILISQAVILGTFCGALLVSIINPNLLV